MRCFSQRTSNISQPAWLYQDLARAHEERCLVSLELFCERAQVSFEACRSPFQIESGC